MLYLSDLHGSVVIILKNTLKWIPIRALPSPFLSYPVRLHLMTLNCDQLDPPCNSFNSL